MISHRRRFLCASLLVALLTAATAAAATKDAPQVTFAANAVTAAGITPGGTVFFFSVARDQVQYGAARVVVRKIPLTDLENRGTVELKSTAPIEANGLWIVIDEASGRYTMVRSPDNPLPVQLLESSAIRLTNDGQSGKIELPLTAAWLLIVRPGEGTWTSTVHDGGAADADGTPNGMMTIPTGKLKHLKTKEKQLDRFTKDDMVFVIDAVTYRVFMARTK
jgi:hypothetical protein